MHFLALGSFETLLSLANLLISSAITIALFYIGSKTSRIEKLEGELKSATSDFINAKMEVISREIETSLQSVRETIERIEERMNKGDGKFDSLQEHAAKNQITTITAAAQIREYVAENYATKADVRELAGALRKLEIAVARLSQQREYATHPD